MLQEAIHNIGVFGMAIMAVTWVGAKIYKSIREDRADTSISEGTETLVTGLADQYKLFAEANKTLTQELLAMRKNNLFLESETTLLRKTINDLQLENTRLLEQLAKLTEEIENLKRTVHQLTRI